MAGITQKRPFYSQGLRFSCARCSACCRHESGFVFLSEKDLSCLMTALNMEYQQFVTAFCRWIPSQKGGEQLSLKEKPNFDCIFWGRETGCSVYHSRPGQCRAFPFWSSVLQSEKSWALTAEDCPGMGCGDLFSVDTIEKWLVLRQNEPIIFRDVQ